MERSWTRLPLRLVRAGITCAAGIGMWWLFTGSLKSDEIVVGIVALALAWTGSLVVGARLGALIRGDAKAIAQIWRVPGVLFLETVALLKLLGKDIAGFAEARSLLRAVHFVHTGTDESTQTCQALATIYTTMTPSSVVIGIDPHARILLFHQLAPSPVSKLTMKLGAAP